MCDETPPAIRKMQTCCAECASRNCIGVWHDFCCGASHESAVTYKWWHQARSMIIETMRKWDKDNVSRLAAALSCYALLSIAPLGILLVAGAGIAFGPQAARGQVALAMGPMLGSEVARAIEAIIVNARAPGPGIASTILGVVVLLLGASGVFVELQSAMNTIWNVSPIAGTVVPTFFRRRLISIVMILSGAVLMLALPLLSATRVAAGVFFKKHLPGGEMIWQLGIGVSSFVLEAALFAVVFQAVPEIDVAWKNVWPGAIVTAVLFTLGKLLLGVYIGKSTVTSSYGAASSLVALVAWVYYSSQVVFLGAEFTEVYSRRK